VVSGNSAGAGGQEPPQKKQRGPDSGGEEEHKESRLTKETGADGAGPGGDSTRGDKNGNHDQDGPGAGRQKKDPKSPARLSPSVTPRFPGQLWTEDMEWRWRVQRARHLPLFLGGSLI
jgi:hypothetical protein